MRIIKRESQNYPEKLKNISQPPEILYAKGREISILNRPAIAVVGSRNATAYGRWATKTLVEQLIGEKFAIISGMARGIDTIAHYTALNSGGKTIAVLGSGIDVVYPPENRNLYRKINLVLSEFPPGTPPEAKNFPRRNRIIAGLSDAVLVIEAAKRSGSLITARFAAEQGKEVFAVPGPISSPQSEGTCWLIRQGAKLVYDINDILEEL